MKRIQSRRIVMGLGALAFLAGVAMVAIGLFSYLGQGDSGAQSASPGINSENAANPISNRPAIETLAPSPTPVREEPTPAPTAPPPPPLQTAYRMIIEEIEVDATVETFGLDENAIPEVPNDSNSSDPAGIVVWYDFSAQPGTGSNAVFAGHYTWNGLAVFYNLGQLQAGDTIRLVAEDGTELVYAVSANFLVDPEDPSSLQVMRPTPTDTITLITCGGVWTPEPNNPIGGNYSNRQVVQASLVSMNLVEVPQTATTGR